MNDLEKTVIEIIDKILFFIGTPASTDVVKAVTDDGVYHVNLSGDDLGVVIGYHGEGLASLQTVLSLMLAKRMGEYAHLIVDVNGYRRDREEKIKEITRGVVDKVRFTQRAIELAPMVAFERRLAHLAVSEFGDVESESIGEGYNRRVVIKLKAKE